MAIREKRGEDKHRKIWISWEWTDLFRWNKKHFSFGEKQQALRLFSWPEMSTQKLEDFENDNKF